MTRSSPGPPAAISAKNDHIRSVAKETPMTNPEQFRMSCWDEDEPVDESPLRIFTVPKPAGDDSSGEADARDFWQAVRDHDLRAVLADLIERVPSTIDALLALLPHFPCCPEPPYRPIEPGGDEPADESPLPIIIEHIE
jgi:hypothetical protein